MRVPLALALGALLLALPAPAAADVNLVGALHAQPVGPLTYSVDFTFLVLHQEATSYAASLRMHFGDGPSCYLGAAGSATPAGTYASPCPGTAAYTVEHVGSVTRVSFRHVYPDTGTYRAAWYYASEDLPFGTSAWHRALDAVGEQVPVGWHYGYHGNAVAL